MAKNEKVCSEENIKICLTNYLTERLMLMWTMDLISIESRSWYRITPKETLPAGIKETEKYNGMKSGCKHTLSFKKWKSPKLIRRSSGLLFPPQDQGGKATPTLISKGRTTTQQSHLGRALAKSCIGRAPPGQRGRATPLSHGHDATITPTVCLEKVGLVPQWVWMAEHQTKEA